MAKKFLGFTPSQQHTLLSRLGYSGPADRESMDKFIKSSPAAASKMGNFTQRALERLNPKPAMATGGAVVPPRPGDTPNGAEAQTSTETGPDSKALPTGSGGKSGGGASGGGTGAVNEPNLTLEEIQNAEKQKLLKASQEQNILDSFTNPMNLITKAKPGTLEVSGNQLIGSGTGQVRNPKDIQTSVVKDVAQAEAPDKINAETVNADQVSKDLDKALSGVDAATGKPSKKATVQGQLENLMEDFEGGGTPPWASGAMRSAMATMQSRGLGASSMAGAAVVQAAMESAISIASQDAATQAQFEMKNLDNKQQTLIFKTQARITGLLSDQAAENAAKQFNASSKNQTNQFFAGLQESVSKFNADQINAIRQFNAGESNANKQFNSQMDAAREF